MSLNQVQSQLAAHIRQPDVESGPAGIDDRRLKIYRELFYNNIEGFISSGFPILRSIIPDQPWHAMVRDFIVRHRCHSPYFLEISQEFLLYLQQTYSPREADPPFLLELAHYEWVELALDVSEEDVDAIPCHRQGDLLAGIPVVSPLAWSLAYQYPVHRIGPDFQPAEAGAQATFLVVYRNRQHVVGFMQANAVTARLLELLQDSVVRSGTETLKQIATEMQHPQPEQIVGFGLELLQQLRSLDIILGTLTSA